MKWFILYSTKKFISKSLSEYLFLLGTFSLLLFPLRASALFEAGSSVSDAKLISSVEGTGDQKTIWVGLDIHLQPGWKTYWRSPGASGYGLKIDWSASQNLKSANLYWPAPLKFETFKMIANGYKDEVIFPIQVTLTKQHSPLFLKGKLDYLACDAGNCIPQSKTVTLLVPDKPNIPSIHAKEISSAIKHLPEKSNPDLSIKSAQFIHNENSVSYLRLVVFHKLPLIAPEIFIEGMKGVFFDKILSISATDKNAAGETSTIDIPVYKNEKRELVRTPNLIGDKFTITLESGNIAIEKTVVVIAPPISTQATFIMYGVALLGGLILNFMPCVLPVILLKIFSLTKYGGHTPAVIRKALFLSVLGIISSFMLLALVPIILGLLGISFGWGMQFQEPVFLVFMMIILALFTANFWGFYEIILPETVTSLGYNYSSKQGNLGHFLTGMFATLLATPCSAPFLGTAITYALSRGPLDILLIFFFLGVGLSLPFILVMIFPQLATYLPKPGKWMNVFKQVMGWGFFITMLWLFYVLTSQVSMLIALIILGTITSLLFLCWLCKNYHSYCKIYSITAAFIVITSISSISLYAMTEKVDVSEKVNIQKILNKIQQDTKQGKVVFVDVTADWCLTCKANELMVINTTKFKNIMEKNHVELITIDWTSKDPVIYEYLKSFNHNGIPFFAVYGPHMPYGQPLPQILTFSSVNDAIKKAK